MLRSSHHLAHHRGHAILYEAADLVRVRTDGLHQPRIARSFADAHALRREMQAPLVAGRFAEHLREIGTHALHLLTRSNVRVHFRHVLLKLLGDLRVVGLGERSNAAGNMFDRSADLRVVHEHVHVRAHVGARCMPHHAAAHHAAAAHHSLSGSVGLAASRKRSRDECAGKRRSEAGCQRGEEPLALHAA